MVYHHNWLQHLKDSIPSVARLNRLSLYTIALEGWRKGLTLEFQIHTDDEDVQRLQYILSDETETHCFNESSGDLITKEASTICDDKHLTEKYLQEANVPIPKGRTFKNTTPNSEMVDHASHLDFPLVAKPTNGSGGKGVHANIVNLEQLDTAINNIKNNIEFESIIIQEHIEGQEVRLYVLGDEVLSAVNRIPANVIGDGKNSVIRLIEFKNEVRKSVPHLYNRPINIDKGLKSMLRSSGYHLDDVPLENERIFFRKTSNISTGGDPIEVLNELTERQKSIAIQAAKAIPGLEHSGVDLIINENNKNAIVIEVNTKPGIGSHLFPIEGKAQDIPKHLINYYFPHTVNVKRKEDYFFDLQAVFDSLYGGYNSQLVVAPCPNHPPQNIQLLLHTDSEPNDIYYMLKKNVFLYGLNGFIQKKRKGTILLVISHFDTEALLEMKRFITQMKNKLRIKKITEQKYCKPIGVGFEIIDDLKELSLNELENKLRRSEQTIEKLQIEANRLNSRIKKTKNSFSWKITKPLRVMMRNRK